MRKEKGHNRGSRGNCWGEPLSFIGCLTGRRHYFSAKHYEESLKKAITCLPFNRKRRDVKKVIKYQEKKRLSVILFMPIMEKSTVLP